METDLQLFSPRDEGRYFRLTNDSGSNVVGVIKRVTMYEVSMHIVETLQHPTRPSGIFAGRISIVKSTVGEFFEFEEGDGIKKEFAMLLLSAKPAYWEET